MNQPIRCLVVDDEMPARQVLCRQIEKHCPHFQVVQTAHSAAEAFKLIHELAPEVVFLDVRMPRESGLELLDRFEERPFHVVFCTTYDEYAVEALRKQAFDYLLKPVDSVDLKDCARRITHHLRIQEVPINRQAAPGGRRIELITSGQRHFVRHENILYVEASGSYSTLYLQTGKRITVSKNLKRIEEMLQNPLFCRVHNSFLVRLPAVHTCDHRNGMLRLPNGKEVPMAVRKRDEVRRRLVELMIGSPNDGSESNIAAESPGIFEPAL